MATIIRVLKSNETKTHYVIYESGAEREFTFEKTPQTVKTWMETHEAEEAIWMDWIVGYMPDTDERDRSEDCVVYARTEAEAVKIAKQGDAKGMIILECYPWEDEEPKATEAETITEPSPVEESELITIEASDLEAVSEETIMEPMAFEAPMVIPSLLAEAAEDEPVREEGLLPAEPIMELLEDKTETKTETEAQKPSSKTIPISLLDMSVEPEVVLDLGRRFAESAQMGLGLILTAAPVMAQAVKISLSAAVDAWYWLTTYLPIGLRWLVVHLAWLIQDALPSLRKAVAVSLGAGLGILRATAQGATTALIIGAGATVKASRTAAKAGRAIAREAKEGWSLRAEIINEGKAA